MNYPCSVTIICYLQNVGAVTSTSTRTPIYKAFAKGENIGDVTAKGECVGNIADLVCSSNSFCNFQKLLFPVVTLGMNLVTAKYPAKVMNSN